MTGQLKELGAGDKATDVGDNYESIFVLTISEKNKKTELNVFSISVTVL